MEVKRACGRCASVRWRKSCSLLKHRLNQRDPTRSDDDEI
ncbi:hypothetical protein BIFBRE_05100 [Bifidobacterium breve DSM 20213 = JCM 1192]|uniref:Uncharacterized protein n=1 Tax=Bifidobacterium breve DSM 20213 = JCM 1192 TaxID=518634 RepID=D4BSK8_BIFBR|nr:hypothetical protein BIFBRE_05100 [Bifidobacterium breve DSM 20213 = JCM 1192]